MNTAVRVKPILPSDSPSARSAVAVCLEVNSKHRNIDEWIVKSAGAFSQREKISRLEALDLTQAFLCEASGE